MTDSEPPVNWMVLPAPNPVTPLSFCYCVNFLCFLFLLGEAGGKRWTQGELTHAFHRHFKRPFCSDSYLASAALSRRMNELSVN